MLDIASPQFHLPSNDVAMRRFWMLASKASPPRTSADTLLLGSSRTILAALLGWNFRTTLRFRYALKYTKISLNVALLTSILRVLHGKSTMSSAPRGELKWDLKALDKTLSRADNQLPMPALRETIGAMMKITDNTINAARRIASELRPSILDDLGLLEAVEWQALERPGQDRNCL